MSNSMSVEKIFIVLAVIIGLGSIADLAYSLFLQRYMLEEVIRCGINLVLAIGLYCYFNKKHQAVLNKMQDNQE